MNAQIRLKEQDIRTQTSERRVGPNWATELNWTESEFYSGISEPQGNLKDSFRGDEAIFLSNC